MKKQLLIFLLFFNVSIKSSVIPVFLRFVAEEVININASYVAATGSYLGILGHILRQQTAKKKSDPGEERYIARLIEKAQRDSLQDKCCVGVDFRDIVEFEEPSLVNEIQASNAERCIAGTAIPSLTQSDYPGLMMVDPNYSDFPIPLEEYLEFKKKKVKQKRDGRVKIPEKDKKADAPGKPNAEVGYYPPKKWDGKKVKVEGGRFKGKKGYPDKDGMIWVPTGHGPNAHGGPHWDVQGKDGKGYRNKRPPPQWKYGDFSIQFSKNVFLWRLRIQFSKSCFGITCTKKSQSNFSNKNNSKK